MIIPPIGLMRPKTPFVWSQTFAELPSDGLDVRDMLGIDGTISTDLGEQCVSHVAMLNRSDAWEVGSRRYIAGGGGGLMDDGLSAVSDGDFNGGGFSVLDFPTTSSVTTLSAPADFPSVSDGSRSFMAGFVGKITDNTGINPSRYLIHSRTQGSPFEGWVMFQDASVDGRLIARLAWADGVTAVQLNLDNAYAVGEPFICVYVLDFFNDQMRIYASGNGGGVVSASVGITVPASTFHETGTDLKVGSWNFGSNQGFIGRSAAFWTAEWDASIDDGFGVDNIEHFLKKTDGEIAVTSPQHLPVLAAGSNGGALTRCWRNPNTGASSIAGVLQRRRATSPIIADLGGTADFTVEGWFYDDSNSSTHVCLIAYYDPNSQFSGWTIRFDHATVGTTALVQFRSALGQTAEITPRPSHNAWHHVAITRLSGTCQWYLDGSAINASFAYAGAITARNDELVICGAPRTIYDGAQDRVADIRIWSDARTAGEISSNYNVPLFGNEANLVAYWPLQSDSLDYGPNGYHLNQAGAGEFMSAGNGPVP